MMFEARRPSIPRRRAAAFALTPLFLALVLLAGADRAAAQQWPDVNVYHSPNDDGVDPRSETCPPGCLCDGGGSGATVMINFDDLDPYTVVSSQYPEATFIPDGTEIWAYPDAGTYGSSPPNWIRPMMDCYPCTEDLVVDFTSPVSNLSFVAVPTDNDYGGATIDVYEDGVLSATVNVDVDIYDGTLVDLSAYSNVTRIHIRGVFNRLVYDNFSFDTGGGEQDCLIEGGDNEVLHLWIDGGPSDGAGEFCKRPPDGNTGHRLCGADITIEITRGTGRITDFRPVIATLVHNPVCAEPPGDDDYCPLPADTTRVRMNFRRGEGTPPLGPRKVADLRIDSTGSTEQAPTTIVVSGDEAASANLLSRPFPAGGEAEVIAEGLVGAPGPCVLQCDLDNDGVVGVLDYGILASSWGADDTECVPPPPASDPQLRRGDCDCDGVVGFSDFSLLSNEWLQECPAQ
jgi:hypothetical protein